MPTLKEIAKVAGVNISTVSRALRNHPAISEGTKKEIWEIANGLGYQLKDNKNSTHLQIAGVIIPEITSGYYSKLAYLALKRLKQKGLSGILGVTNFDQNTMIEKINFFDSVHAKCLLLVTDDAENISEDIIRAIEAAKAPVMLITSKYFPNIDFDCLYIDEEIGTLMAVEHLIKGGYKRIGFIGEEKTLGRYNAYIATMNDYNMSIDNDHIGIGTERAEEGGYLRMKEILARGRYPDALYVSYDKMAVGAMHAISEIGLSIPGDIAIVGFDDVSISSYVYGGLTTIQNPYQDMISIAIGVLMKRIVRPNMATQQIALRPKLIIRGTT